MIQANANKSMVEAALQKNKLMEDANMFLLMTHSTDDVISECASTYLKLRQEAKLERLKAQ